MKTSLSEATLDHKELSRISLLYLGGSLSSPIPIYASGAHHHACWMAKIIYTIETALFRDQLKESFKPRMLADSIQNFATLTVLFVKFWLCSTNVTDAPQLDPDFAETPERGKNKTERPRND